MISNRDDADEVFQQTSLILWKKWEQFDQSREFLSWACGIAHNEVRNFLRRHKHNRVYLSEMLMDEVAQTRLKSQQQLEDRRRSLAECLEQLKTPQRDLIEECYSGKNTIKEVAQRLGMTPPALYMKLKRIRQILFECINRSLTAGEDAK